MLTHKILHAEIFAKEDFFVFVYHTAPDRIPHMVNEVESDRVFRRVLSRLSAGRKIVYKAFGQPNVQKCG